MRVYVCWLVCQAFWCLGACLLALWLVGWLAGCLACWFVVVVWLLVWSLVRLGSCLLIVSFRLGFEPDPAELKHTMAPRRRARESGQRRSMRKDLGRQGKHCRTPACVGNPSFSGADARCARKQAQTSCPAGLHKHRLLSPAAHMIMDKSLKFVRGRGRKASAPASHRQRPPSNIYGLLLPLRRGTARV